MTQSTVAQRPMDECGVQLCEPVLALEQELVWGALGHQDFHLTWAKSLMWNCAKVNFDSLQPVIF